MKTMAKSELCLKRKPRPKAGKPISAASMGRALVVFASSCAALSSTSITASRFTSAPPHRHSEVVFERSRNVGIAQRRNPSKRTSALQYRDSSEDLPVNLRVESKKAVANILLSSSISAPTPTRFLRRLPHIPTLRTSARSGDEQQNVMDEYLEYVEKRYSRMHRREIVPRPMEFPSVKLFLSRMAVHTRARVPAVFSGSTRTTSAISSTEDPLYILGLSGLASARLRQKLSLPLDLREEFSVLTSAGATAASLLSPLIVRLPHSDIPVTNSIGGRHSSFVDLNFLGQFNLMIKALGRLASAFSTSVKIMAKFSCRVVPEILKNGGIMHSIRMISVASVAFLFMIRPLFKGALSASPFQG